MSESIPDPGAGEGSPPGEGREPKVGEKIGSYRLVRLLGEGATGRVFEVQHLTIGRRAAMKILAPTHSARPGAVRRLFSEAQAVNKITHPHIVEVTDMVAADDPEGVNAIVMELLEGQSLGQAIAATPGMPPTRYLPILSQVADALAAAHGANFIHRDLKPENVFLTTHHGHSDYVKLLDFGLAKIITGGGGDAETGDAPRGAPRSHDTAEGIFVGTPAYASPEQVAGKALDRRTDIYSLGVILYELLCGRIPFDGRHFGEFVIKHLTAAPPPTAAEVLRTPLGRALDAVARRCLRKDPAERFDSATELKDIFDRLASGQIPPGLAGAPSRRRWVLVAAGGLAVAAVVATAISLAALPLSRPRKTAVARPSATTTRAAVRRPRVVPLVPEHTVVLQFESDPPGAETRQVGGAAAQDSLGFTPFSQEVPASDAAMEYEMVLPGYAPRRDRVALTPDPRRKVVGGPLRKLPPRASRSTPTRKPGRNETLNPFGR